MKLCVFAAVVALASIAMAEEQPPRNPFWPQGYDGLRHPITTEPRIKPKPKAVIIRKPEEIKTEAKLRKEADAAAKAKEEARIAEENRIWNAARDNLRFGGIMAYRKDDGNRAYAITINDRIYMPGDLVSCNIGDMRFTWQIEEISSEGKLKLRRVKYGAHK